MTHLALLATRRTLWGDDSATSLAVHSAERGESGDIIFLPRRTLSGHRMFSDLVGR